MKKDNEVVGIGMYEPEHELFKLSIITKIENNNIDTSDNILSYNTCSYDMWHQRLGHPGISKMERIMKDNLLAHMDINKSVCEHCVKGKMMRKPFKEGERDKELLGSVHSYICGPLSCKTYCNKEYFITFIDDFSTYAQVYLISR